MPAIQFVFDGADVEALFQSPDTVNHEITITNTGLLEVDGSSIEGTLNLNNITGTLGIAKGGSGQTTANAAFAAFSPMTANGDLITRAGGVPVALAIGTAGQVLSVVAGAPAWVSGGFTDEQVKVSAADTTPGYLNPKTASGLAITRTILSPGANEQLEFAVNEAALTLNNIGGTLSIAKGGTGQITAILAFNALSPLTTAGDTMYRDGTNNVRLPIGTTLQLYRTNAGATAPEWFTPSPTHYIFSYDTTTQNVAVANTFQDVTFDTNAQLNGWTHTAATADFTCAKTGLYKVSYYANVERTAAGSTTPEIIGVFNGVQVAGSQGLYETTANNLTAGISKDFLLSATTGQVLKLQFTGGSTTTRIVGAQGVATVKPSITITVTPVSPV